MEQQFSNLDSVMEPETISKNGASLKSQMSRSNFKIFAMLAFMIFVTFVFTGCATGNKDNTNDKELTCEQINSSTSKFTTLHVSIGSSSADYWGITGYEFELWRTVNGVNQKFIVAESNNNTKRQTFTFKNVPDEYLADLIYDTYNLSYEYFGKEFRLLQWRIAKGSEVQLQNLSISNQNTKIAIISYSYIRISAKGEMGSDDGPNTLGNSVQAQMKPDPENEKLKCPFSYCDLVYSNSDCDITGYIYDTISVDVRLRKGWNKVFHFWNNKIITTDDIKDSHILWYQTAG